VVTTSASYKTVAANLPRSLSNTAAEPQVARESKYYLANIEKVKSIDDFLKNDRLYRYAMKAFGLEDMTYAKAFMKKVLTEGVAKSDSFANTLADPRYKEFAIAFDFAADGDTTTIFERTRQGTVDRYVRQTLEQQAGEQNEGVRLALYFARKAPELTSPLAILADKALIQVVQTALGLPAASSAMDIDKQAEMIGKRIDVADFKDAKKLDKFIARFTSMWELSNGSGASTAGAGTLLAAQPVEAGIGADVLASLQNLKLGGR
jgi:hypothetical protein